LNGVWQVQGTYQESFPGWGERGVCEKMQNGDDKDENSVSRTLQKSGDKNKQTKQNENNGKGTGIPNIRHDTYSRKERERGWRETVGGTDVFEQMHK